jgi:short-subunit dehydrogenase
MNSKSSPVAWITGANKGIGAALVADKSARAATVAASSRKEILPDGAKNPFVCDVRNPESINNCYDAIVKEYGAVDILINNAGVAAFTSYWETSVEDADSMIETNLRGVWLCTKQVLPAMIERGNGIIVNILSVAAIKTFTNCALYAASKAGALAMSRTLREEVREFGIKVIDILPGATETEIWDTESRQEFSPRMMQPSDVAGIVWQAIDMSKGAALLEEIIIRPPLGDL